MPFLAATINYDNVFVPILPPRYSLTFTIFDDFAARRVSAARLLGPRAAYYYWLPSKISVLPVALVLD